MTTRLRERERRRCPRPQRSRPSFCASSLVHRSPCARSTGFHVADLEGSSHPLQSITEISSLEEFMAAATMAERSFTAEKVNIRFVPEDAPAPGKKG
jgi:hypothetical protein